MYSALRNYPGDLGLQYKSKSKHSFRTTNEELLCYMAESGKGLDVGKVGSGAFAVRRFRINNKQDVLDDGTQGLDECCRECTRKARQVLNGAERSLVLCPLIDGVSAGSFRPYSDIVCGLT